MDEGSGLSIEWLEDHFEFLAQGAFPRDYVELQLQGFGFEKILMFTEELYGWGREELLDQILSFRWLWSLSLFCRDDDELLHIIVETPVAAIQNYALEELAERKIDKYTIFRALRYLKDGDVRYAFLRRVLRDPLPSLDELVSFRKTLKALERNRGIDALREYSLLDPKIVFALVSAQPDEVRRVYKKVKRQSFFHSDFPDLFHVLAPKLFPYIWI